MTMSERTCSIDGCDGRVLARGWCARHYQHWKNHGVPGPAERIRRPAASFGVCVADGCGGVARRNGLCSSCSAKARRSKAGGCTIGGCGGRADARGLCGKHYQQIRNGALDHPLAADIRRDAPCSVDGCGRAAYARGFCNMHWTRNHLSGDPGEAESRKAVYEPGQVCAVDSCERPPRWRQYCASHARRLRRFGVTAEEVADIFLGQNGRCAICRAKEPSGSGDWHIDHDHVTGKIRGLLCNRCNLAIGLLQDDPDVMDSAARYVREPVSRGPAALKILFHSNYPGAQTGYGTQTGLFVPRIAGLGHEVVISCMTGIQGQPGTWEGFRCLPPGHAAYSADVVATHARSFFGRGPGLLLILFDAWGFLPAIDDLEGLATAVWSPLHSKPMSGGDKLFYGNTSAQPIAMSRYGEAEMRAVGLQPCYVPHGVDTSVFRPLDAGARDAARDALKVPRDAYMVAMVGANKGTSPPRKGWGEAFAAFAQFRERHPDAVLYCHTMANSTSGIDLRPIAASLGIEKHVIMSSDYAQITGLYQPPFMAGLMGCADVLLNPSYGEGFGLAIVEAQACGTPVVVGNNSAQSELCGAGWLAECQPVWVPDEMTWWHAPRIKSVVAGLEKAYRRRGDVKLRAKAREFAVQYDADTVAATYWKPALEMLEQYCGAVPVRSQRRNHGAVPLPTIEADGLTWILRGHHTGDGLVVGHEDQLAPVFDRMLPEGGVLVDVGAHVGRWALRMAGKASRVVAVEANPGTAAQLRAHIEMNDLEDKVEVLEVAAWDSHTRLRLEDPNGQTSGGSTRVLDDGDGTVEAAPLDVLLSAEPRIDLVKLDVEGADLHALRGLRETLARLRPKLLIERHDIYGHYKLSELTGLLADLGYVWEHFNITLDNGNPTPYLTAEPEGDTR